jgi:hypothetical protein
MAVFNSTTQNSRPQGGKVSKILLEMVDGRIPIQVSTSFFLKTPPPKKNEKKIKYLPLRCRDRWLFSTPQLKIQGPKVER